MSHIRVGQSASFAVHILREGKPPEPGKMYGTIIYVDKDKIVLDYWDPIEERYMRRDFHRPFQPDQGVEIYER